MKEGDTNESKFDTPDTNVTVSVTLLELEDKPDVDVNEIKSQLRVSYKSLALTQEP